MNRLLVVVVLFSVAALGADVSGAWKATAEGAQGAMERTFVFKVEGTKLTGETTSSMLGKSVIENGKVDGDNISFTITAKLQDNEMKLNYKGKVTGDEMKLTVEVPDMGGGGGQDIVWTAKRAK